MSVQQLDDEAEHTGRLPPDTQGGDGVAYPPDLVTIRVEDADARQVRDEHPRHCAHCVKASRRRAVFR
jgi:hypothetical protein